MGLNDYIFLLNDLENSAFQNWGLLLTVGIGLAAYKASITESSKNSSILIFVLFLLFAGANFNVFKDNYNTRELIRNTIKTCDSQHTIENYDAVIHGPIIVQFVHLPCTRNFLHSFQILIYIVISITILVPQDKIPKFNPFSDDSNESQVVDDLSDPDKSSISS